MKLTLEVKEAKVPFVLELLEHFSDFVSVETETVKYHSNENEESSIDGTDDIDDLLNETSLSAEDSRILKKILEEDDNLLRRLAQS